MVIFPEGHLSRVPGFRAFRLGAFLTAAEARVPVIPVVLGGTRRCSRRVIAYRGEVP